MGLNDTVSAERVHIGFFGMRNAGKSSVVNAVTGQQLALVSAVKGTTTDPVQKAMELLPIGPVVIIDTPGVDDIGTLGSQRVARSLQILEKIHLAVLVVDATKGLQPADLDLIKKFEQKNISYCTVYNKCDLLKNTSNLETNALLVSAQTGKNINLLKEKLGVLAGLQKNEKTVLQGLLEPGNLTVLVTPIDNAAPKGRLILPQQQVIREVLDCGGIAVVTQPEQLKQTLKTLNCQPKIVITDSQAFGPVSSMVPQHIPLTSFSILFARYKGSLPQAVKGAAVLDGLKPGCKILIAEGCTHHRQCGDIGTQKLPAFITKHCGFEPQFDFVSGGDFKEDLSSYALVIHCGACMLNAREMQARMARCAEQQVPITNYGIAIAHLHGILKRAVAPFPDIANLLA